VSDRPRARRGPRASSALAGWFLAAGLLAANLFVTVHTVQALRESLAQHRAAASLSAQNLARLLEESLSASFDRVDMALLAVVDEYERQAATGRVDIRSLGAVLARQKDRTPDLLGLRVVDRQGVFLLSVPSAPTRVDVSDREYFDALRATPERQRYVSRPFVSRVTGTPVMAIARRLSGADGSFAGVVLGVVSITRLTDSLWAIDVGPHGSVSLRFADDMGLVARTGPKGPNTEIGNTRVSRELRDLVASGKDSAAYEATTLTDGFTRSFAYRRLARYPLYAIVGMASEDYLAEWRTRAAREGVLALAFAAFTILGAVAGHRAWRHQVQAEDQLSAEKERLAVTLRSIGDGVIATDLDRRIVLVNAAAERFTGWPAEDAQGRPVDEVFRLVDERSRVASLAGERSGAVRREVLRARDGRELVVAWSAMPIRDREDRTLGLVLVFKDLTTLELTEDELARAQKLESLAVLAGGIAHDFNNLLTGIVGNISFARSEVAGDGEAGLALADAEAASLRARGLTQQLLTFSKGGAPVKRPVDLTALIEETARFAAHGAATACRFELARGLCAVVDRGQIGQVIQNLVLNGIQAMSSGGQLVVRAARVEVPAGNGFGLEPGPYVRISVQDRGHGIPPEVLPRVFDPFFTTKREGKGLGLSICHSVVRRHGGHVEVESKVGEGSTFRVYVPASSDGAGAPEARATLPAPCAGGQRILVMDDEEMVRTMATRTLARLGYDAVAARDGEEALSLYAEARSEGRAFAAVLMDLTVPGGLGGKETMARLRELDPGVVGVVSSGYSNDPVMARYAEHGFRAVLAKPYVAADLEVTFRELLAG